MANTVIAIRSSGTAAATPSLGVIANGEIALNFADGIIYYKTSSNTLGSIKTTQPAGLTTEVQFNDAGVFGANANFTFNKTLATLNVKNINVSTNLTTVNLTATSITTGTGAGGIIAGANVIYSNVFVANSGGYVQFSDGSRQYVANAGGSVAASSITGVMNLTQGGTNAIAYTTGAFLTSNGTAFVSVANTGTAGTHGNAAYHPVITTDAYGRVSAVTNTLVQIAASQVTSGNLAIAQGGTNNNGGYTTGAVLQFDGTKFVTLANTGTAGTYGSSTIIPVITTDAYGRVTSVTNTAIAAGGTGNANTFGYLANSVIIANSTGYLSNTSNLLYYSANNTLAIAGNVTIKSANTSISNSATFVFNSTLNSLDTVFA